MEDSNPLVVAEREIFVIDPVLKILKPGIRLVKISTVLKRRNMVSLACGTRSLMLRVAGRSLTLPLLVIECCNLFEVHVFCQMLECINVVVTTYSLMAF